MREERNEDWEQMPSEKAMEIELPIGMDAKTEHMLENALTC